MTRRLCEYALCVLACVPPLFAAWCVGRLMARVVEPVIWRVMEWI